jgi:hypothetical protein
VVAAAGAEPAVQVWRGGAVPVVLRGAPIATTFLRWVNHDRILEAATPEQTWLWDPRAAIGGPLTEPNRTLLGDAYAFELVDGVRWRLLPSRTPLGFHAWIASQIH